MPMAYHYEPYITPTPTPKGDLLIGASLLACSASQAKICHDLKSFDDEEFDDLFAERIAESLKVSLTIHLNQYVLTAASRRQLQVWIDGCIEGYAGSFDLPKRLQRYLELDMSARVAELVAEANPEWPLACTGREIKELHQNRMTLGIVELLQTAYEVYAKVVIGGCLRRRPFRGIWRFEIPMLVLDDCIRLGWKDPSWPVDRHAVRIRFGSHQVTPDFKTRFMAALEEPIQTWSRRMEGLAVDDREPIFEGEEQWPGSLADSSPVQHENQALVRQNNESPPVRKKRGRPSKFTVELKEKALAAQGGKAKAQILYGLDHPTTQDGKNASRILRHYQERASKPIKR
jgi:hypothetical protein